MKTIACAVIIVLSAAGLAGCVSHSQPGATAATVADAAPAAPPPAATNLLSNEKARNSYAMGMTLGRNFQTQTIEVDAELLARGIKDTQSGKTLLTPAELRETMDAFQKGLMAKQRQMREAALLKNKAEGEAFLATNKNNAGVITLPDGLQYQVVTEGSGTPPKPDDIVTVNYRGTLLDGTEFDSSFKKGEPAKFPIGGVIPGWTEALQKMNIGSKWRLFIPSELAYGERGRPGIPPNSVLTFEVELLGAEPSTPPPPPEPLTSDIVKVPSLEEMKKGAKIEVIKPEDAAKAQAAQTQSSPTNRPAK
jgi:FKBP-type peptidyl-prolyl cis-trans isomerase FklB